MSVLEWLEYHLDKGTSLANTIKDDLGAVVNRQVTPFKIKFNPDSVTHVRRTKDVVDEFHHILTRAISSLTELDKSMMNEFNTACPAGSRSIKQILCNEVVGSNLNRSDDRLEDTPGKGKKLFNPKASTRKSSLKMSNGTSLSTKADTTTNSSGEEPSSTLNNEEVDSTGTESEQEDRDNIDEVDDSHGSVIMVKSKIEDNEEESKDEEAFPINKDPLEINSDEEQGGAEVDLSQSLLINVDTAGYAGSDGEPSPTGTVLLRRGDVSAEDENKVVSKTTLKLDQESGVKNNDAKVKASDDEDESDHSRPPSRSGTVFIPISKSRKSYTQVKEDQSEVTSLGSPASPTGTVLIPRSTKKMGPKQSLETPSKSKQEPEISEAEVVDDQTYMDVDDFVPPTPESELPVENEDVVNMDNQVSIHEVNRSGKRNHSTKEDDSTDPEDIFASSERRKPSSTKSKVSTEKEAKVAKQSDKTKSGKIRSKEETAARRGALATSSDEEESKDNTKLKMKVSRTIAEKKVESYDKDSDPKLKPDAIVRVELNPVVDTILQALKDNNYVNLSKASDLTTDEESDGSIALLDKELKNLLKFNPAKEVKQKQSSRKKKTNPKKAMKSGAQNNSDELSSGEDESCNEAKISSGVTAVARSKLVECSDLDDLSDTQDANLTTVLSSDDSSKGDSKKSVGKGQKELKKNKSTKMYKQPVIELSDDSDDDERRRALRDDSDSDDFTKRRQKKRSSNSEDSEDAAPLHRNTRKKKSKAKKKLLSDSEEGGATASEADIASVSDDSDEESDFKSKKKSKGKSKRKKGASSDEEPQKKKKRKRIKVEKDTDDDSEASKVDTDDSDIQEIENVPASQKRKNIKKIMSDKRLEKTTKEAEKEEEERRQRVLEKQKLFNGINEKPVNGASLARLVLDFDAESKQPVIEVDSSIVKKLKPHQAEGVKFMYTACFESVEMIKKGKGGGCILAHCMGLGKTLQTVAFTQTMLSHKDITGVKTVLIVCPLNTVTNWLKEYKSWLSNVETKDQPRLHALWDCKKDADRVDAMKCWQRRGGVGIIHYDMFRNMVNKALGTQKGGKGLRMTLKEAIKQTLLDPGPDLVVCDEGHLLKNHKSKLTLALSQMKTTRRVVLTGTPLQNNLIEYHTMVDFVKPNLLGTLKEFSNRFVQPIKNGQHKDSNERDVKIMKRRAHVLHAKLDGCVQRLDYSVLTPYLPPKHEYCIIIKLSEKQKLLYRQYLDSKVSTDATERGRRILQHYAVLIKIVAHPVVLTMKKNIVDSEDEDEGSMKDFIVNSDEDDTTSRDSDVECMDPTAKPSKRKTRSSKLDPNEESNSSTASVKDKLGNEWYSSVFQSKEEMYDINLSGKMVVLQEILKTCETIDDRVLVFSQYLTTLDIIEEFLAEWDDIAEKENKTEKVFPPTNTPCSGRWRKGLEYFRIDGSTKCDDRQKHCDTFNKKSAGRAKLFLISTKAGGLGINLFGANRVVIFDASWNPSNDMQSIFRVYRFGQSKPCYIYRLVAQATMEEKIYNRQVVKLSLSSRVVDEHQVERHFKFDDINEMFKFNPDERTERPTPPVPKDRLLADLLISHKDWIDSYFEHDTLLTNKVDEVLSEEERKQAWEEYRFENERRATLPPTTQSVPRLDPSMMEFVSNILRGKFADASTEQIILSTTNVVQKFIDWTQLVQRKRNMVPNGLETQLDRDILTLQNYCQQAVGKEGMGHLISIVNANFTRRQNEQEQRLQQAIAARNQGRAQQSTYINMNSVANQVFRGAQSSVPGPRPSRPTMNIPSLNQILSGFSQPPNYPSNNAADASSSRRTTEQIDLD